MHKIDRSTRNIRDWADLSEVIDSGVDVQFVHDQLDLTTRGGRITADIQAVLAADYIRNLREEADKGIYGRYKQGLLPHGGPVGYLNRGGGQPKVIDPRKGPLVHRAFELYASGEYSLRRLAPKAERTWTDQQARRIPEQKRHLESLAESLLPRCRRLQAHW